MAGSKSGQGSPAEEWEQVALLTTWPEQRAYEVIRPVVLFGRSPAVRARETGTPRSSLYRQAAAFAERGMASLFAPPASPKHRTLPPEIRQAILALKAEHPAFRPREITRICAVRFGRSLSHHTVQRILAEEPLPPPPARRFPPFHAVADPAERRLAIIRLHIEGWLRFVSSKPAAALPGDGEPGKEAYRTWTTGRSMWGAIPHRCGEQRNASPPR